MSILVARSHDSFEKIAHAWTYPSDAPSGPEDVPVEYGIAVRLKHELRQADELKFVLERPTHGHP